jgi:hypothetical protein
VQEADKRSSITRHISASQALDATPIPLNTTISTPSSIYANGNTAANANMTVAASAVPRSLSSNAVPTSQSQESPVMNETLSVIQEHISNMSTPRNSGHGERRGTNDSGSEYSSNIDRRLSYINGEETDEEEDNMHNQQEVSLWNATQVADYLASVGVEQKHCEVFRDQEISGDVLLGMDQASVFLKEFDLGSVGRRLKTWQKVKALQDEVNGISPADIARRTQWSSIDGSSESAGTRFSNGPVGGNRMSNSTARSESRTTMRYSSQKQYGRSESMTTTPVSPISPVRDSDTARPSAALIRELNHSRRHSSIDSTTMLQQSQYQGSLPPTPTTLTMTGHKKLPSFDRNWTMGNQSESPSLASRSRPVSSYGGKNLDSEDDLTGVTRTTPYEFDRGYFSGTEADGRQRNVLKKRGGSHSRNSSYTDEQRIRTATTNARHSRFGSVDSIRDSHVSPASQKYYGMSITSRRSPSIGSVRPVPPPKDASPIVTKLDDNYSGALRSPTSMKSPDWLLPSNSAVSAARTGFRAISDAVTGTEKARVGDQLSSPTESNKSPSRTGSSTSGGPSFELDSPGAGKAVLSSSTTPSSRTSRKKSKKETSAYTRGLEKKTPQEAMIDCDYSGWMKKKNTNLMTTWKSRLFILKGRRLSYYYSENDTQEQGLIDISFHRVLPADNDRLTGLHATLTGATSSPTSPQNSSTPTIASTEAAAEEAVMGKSPGDQMFIFKLVPPRAGLSRAVTFTKPTVHYFAVPNIAQGRLWMAALMKATIDRDDSTPIVTTYQQKTISLAKARAMRHRPPALMGLEEGEEEKRRSGEKEKILSAGAGEDEKKKRHGEEEEDSEKKENGMGLGLSLGALGYEKGGQPQTA